MQTFAAIIISFFAAAIPTVVYSGAFYWADRYEREPRSLVVVAVVWGAIPAILVSLLFELSLGSPVVDDSNVLSASIMEMAVVAPIIEEVAKAAALLGLFLWKRDEFDGVLDGLIYGALIGFGFAMTENFIYFTGAYLQEGFLSLTFTIFLRSVVFGLNHALYTSLTGMGFGLARNVRNRAARVALILLGLLAAILVHSLHNLSIVLSSVAPAAFLLSLFIAACGLALIVLSVYLSWRHERYVIRTELAEELGSIITPEDLLILTSSWRSPMRDRTADSDRYVLYVELAVRKRRMRMLGAEREHELLGQVREIRQQIEILQETDAQRPESLA